MKLKCPGCQQLLNIPDAAAGRVVKCPCGKALKAPALPAGAAAASRPAPTQPPAQPTPAARPTAAAPRQPTSAAAPAMAAGTNPGNVFGDDFDLTDTDLEPVRGVSRPGQVVDRPKTNENALLRKFAKEESGWEDSIEGAHPAKLKSMGGSNFMSALFDGFILLLVMGATTALPIPPEFAAAKGITVVIMGLFGGMDIAFLAGAGVSCFLPYRQCWFFLLFAYSFGLMVRLTIFITAFMFESSVIWKLITASWLLFSVLSIVYLHSDEVRKFYETRKVPKKYMMLFDGIGILVGGLLMVIFLLMVRGD